jgi:hypothetical protein
MDEKAAPEYRTAGVEWSEATGAFFLTGGERSIVWGRSHSKSE